MSATTPTAARRFFERRYREVGSPARAAAGKAYLKSDLRFYGATVPEILRAASDFAREHRDLGRSELRKIVDELWSTDVYELRSAGIALLSRYVTLLEERDLPWLVGFVRRSKTWAHVDWLAASVIGGVVGDSRTALRRLPAWARDDNFWVRRTALLAQLRLLSHEAGDFALFARLAAPMLDEREFFIRKAIGWVLREVSKKRPKLVFRVPAREPRRGVRSHAQRRGEVSSARAASCAAVTAGGGLGAAREEGVKHAEVVTARLVQDGRGRLRLAG